LRQQAGQTLDYLTAPNNSAHRMQNSNTFKRIRIAKENPLAGRKRSVPTAASPARNLPWMQFNSQPVNLDHWICRT